MPQNKDQNLISAETTQAQTGKGIKGLAGDIRLN